MRVGINLLSESEKSAGVRTYTTELLRALAELNSDSRYCVFVSRKNLDTYYLEKASFSYIAVRFPTGSAIVRRALEQIIVPVLARRAAVNVIHSVNNVGMVLATIPFVVTIHDLAPFRLGHRFGALKRLYLKSLVPISARRASKILTVSEQVKREIMGLCGVDGDKVVVTHHGMSTGFSVGPQDQRSKIGAKWGIEQDYVLYVGTLEPGKNVRRIVEAFAQVRSRLGDRYTLVIAGRPGWLYGDIFEAVKRLGLEKGVIFTGYVPEEDLPGLYRGATLFVFPSLYEGFGLPVLEAMACGTPVVTSNTSSLPEVAGDAAVLVDPYSVEEIAEAMVRVLTNEGLRRELIRKGRERAKLFTWERCARETLKVYEEVYRESR